jgi:hypothetical protein
MLDIGGEQGSFVLVNRLKAQKRVIPEKPKVVKLLF